MTSNSWLKSHEKIRFQYLCKSCYMTLARVKFVTVHQWLHQLFFPGAAKELLAAKSVLIHGIVERLAWTKSALFVAMIEVTLKRLLLEALMSWCSVSNQFSWEAMWFGYRKFCWTLFRLINWKWDYNLNKIINLIIFCVSQFITHEANNYQWCWIILTTTIAIIIIFKPSDLVRLIPHIKCLVKIFE